MEIVDGRRNFGASLEEIARGGHIARRADRLGHKVRPMHDLSDTPALLARVDRNRWIVDCPDCRSAEFAFVSEPVFMCSECFNGAVGGRWRRVKFPKNRDRIEQTLKKRPLPATRNWTPGEPVAALERENREHGLAEEVV